MSNKLSVAEHFYSIQGEGKYMGVPAVFLRLSGCNLICGGQGTQFDGELHNGATWRCDTLEVWMKGNSITIDEVVSIFDKEGYTEKLKDGAHLVITGGEPLIQRLAVIDFLDALKKDVPNLFVEVETNGTLVPSFELQERITHWNVSPKLANSGNDYNSRYNPTAIEVLAKQKSVCFKFVISNEIDLEEVLAYRLQKELVYLMPSCEDIDEFNSVAPFVASKCLEHTFNFSTRLQINLWNKTTGV